MAPEATLESKGGVGFDNLTGAVSADDVHIHQDGIDITADHAEGSAYREIVLTGHATLRYRGAVCFADAIHYFPQTRSMRLENPRSFLPPQFFNGRLLQPAFVKGGGVQSTYTGYSIGENFIATTCEDPTKHYEVRVRSAELFPYDRLILKKVTFVLFGQKLIVIPEIDIPLDQNPRRYHNQYQPEFGRNVTEGWFARFPYAIPEGKSTATFLLLSATEKLGEGYHVEQEYLAGKQPSAFNTSPSATAAVAPTFGAGGDYLSASGYGNVAPGLQRLGTGIGPASGGLFTITGYFADGFARDFTGSFKHQQDIGSGNRITFDTELQRNNFLTTSNETSQSTKFDFAHTDQAHGSQWDLSFSDTSNSSPGFTTSQFSLGLHDTFTFDTAGANKNTLTTALDYSSFTNSASGVRTVVSQLTSQLSYQHQSRDYTLQINANDQFNVGANSSAASTGQLEKLPEILFATDTQGWEGGFLKQFPLHFDFGLGRYTEPSDQFSNGRVLFGVTLQDTTLLKGRTEITTGGGFEQRMYEDGAAEYIIRDITRLREHLGGRSGIDITYTYQQPEGGTPFLFDQFTKSHYLTAQAGYLDDSHFQLTAGVGYDLSDTNPTMPFQTLTSRMMWRPNRGFRFDGAINWDPNTGRFVALSDIIRIRGKRDTDPAVDFLMRYDPTVHKFSQINSQLDLPIAHTWRFSLLLRYDGELNTFDSENFELKKEWDCMEAALTYSENPLGFQNERQWFFTIRLKALPFNRGFGSGPSGEAIGAGIGDLY
jgi:hypothetical protein